MTRRLLREGVTLLMLLFSVLCTSCAPASDKQVLAPRDGRNLNRYVDWLADPDGRLTINDVLLAANQSRFEPSHGKSAVGLTGAAYWLRLRIEPPIESPGDGAAPSWLLVEPPYQDDLRLYFPDNSPGNSPNNSSNSPGYRERLSGALVPFSEGRDLDFGTPAFRLPPFHDRSMLVYLRVQTFQGTAFQLSLWHKEALLNHLQRMAALLDILYGIIIGLVLYNLFLAISLRDLTYSTYVLMVCANLVFIAHVNGDDFMYLWPRSPWIQIRTGLVLPCVWTACAGLFSLIFFSLRTIAPALAKIVTGYALLQPAIILLGLSGFHLQAAYIFYASAVPWTAFLYGIGIYRLRQGFVPARYGLVGFSILIVGVICYYLRLLGLFQPGAVSEHAIQVGTTFETLMFSLALATRIRLLQQERDVALHDPLTGLLTRRLFDDRFQQACSLAQRQNAHVALLLIDLDRFKPINDRLGHDAGDAVLKAVAQRLSGVVRTTDSVARFGGDEFAIILNWPFDQDLPTVSGQRLIRAVEQPIVHKNHSLQVSLSIGLAFWPEHGADFAALYKAADRALYEAKHAGRATLRVAAEQPASA